MPSQVLLFSICFAVFTSAYLVFKVQRVKQNILTKMVMDTGAGYFLPVFLSAGLWSPELVASTPIHQLPYALVKDQNTKTTTQDLKRWVREKLMLQRWMRDMGHPHFAPLLEQYSIKQWGYKVPTIHRVLHANEINPEIDTALRHSLKSDYDKFRQAIDEFKSRSTFAMVKIPQYEADIEKRACHYLPENLWRFLLEEDGLEAAVDLCLCVVYSFVAYLVIIISATYREAGGPLWAMVAFWLHPPSGRLCLHGASLLCCVLHGPLAGLAALAGAEMWMLATAVYMGASLAGTILISVIPTIIIFACLELIHFHPVMTTEDDGKIFLTLTGFGNVDAPLRAFIRNPIQSRLLRYIFGRNHWTGRLDLAKISGFAFDQVNASSDLILQLVGPSLKNDTCEYLSIINNDALHSNDIRILGDLCEHNSSLQLLRISYHDLITPWARISKFFDWNQTAQKPEADSINYLMDRFLQNPAKHQITSLDFTGVPLTEESIQIANQLRSKIPGIKVQGEKSSEESQEDQNIPYADPRKRYVAFGCYFLVCVWCFWCYYIQLRDPRLFTNI